MTWWPRRIATSDPLRFGVFTGKNARLTMTAPSPKAARIGRQTAARIPSISGCCGCHLFERVTFFETSVERWMSRGRHLLPFQRAKSFVCST